MSVFWQPIWDAHWVVDSWLQGEGLPVVVWESVQPLVDVQYPDEPDNWLQGVGVPVHREFAEFHWQPLWPTQAPVAPISKRCIPQSVAVPEQLLPTMVHPKIGTDRLVREQSGHAGVPAQWRGTFSFRQ